MKNMKKVTTLDLDGNITGIKVVGKDYVMQPNDIEFKKGHKLNTHFMSGDEKPVSKAVKDKKKINKLVKEIELKNLVNVDATAEIAELKSLLGY